MVIRVFSETFFLWRWPRWIAWSFFQSVLKSKNILSILSGLSFCVPSSATGKNVRCLIHLRGFGLPTDSSVINDLKSNLRVVKSLHRELIKQNSIVLSRKLHSVFMQLSCLINYLYKWFIMSCFHCEKAAGEAKVVVNAIHRSLRRNCLEEATRAACV